MPWRWHVLSPCLLLIRLCTISSALCPSDCSCSLDTNGLRRVSCLEGSMSNPIPVDEMDLEMKALDISAPESNWNSLTLGRVFLKFRMLKELRLRRSGITQIGMHTFWGVPTLEVLDLSFNNISALFDHNFRGLLNLIELRLDDNLIVRLTSGVFKHLHALRILTLERNRLTGLTPKTFIKLSNLQVLKLSGNKLFELIPEVFKDILELRTLECRGCEISRINTQIYHLLPYLTHLDLGNNRMQFITADEFRDLRRIHSLRLDGNMLPVVLEKTFINQAELKILCLARNRLVKITNNAFLNLSSLYELDVSYNKLNRVEGISFNPVGESLRKLVLSGNQLTTEILRDVLQTTIKLRELAVADMRIDELPARIFPDHLKALNLSGNNLTNLGLQVVPGQLVDLDISRNKLQGLNESVASRLEQLESLRLHGNPWTCDLCHMKNMVRSENKSVIAFGNATCATPSRLKGVQLKFIKTENLTDCHSTDRKMFTFVKENLFILIGGVGLLLFLVACITFVVWSCLRRKVNNAVQEHKRDAQREAGFENPTDIFGDKSEISFKFALDLTERKVSVSTIDSIKKDTHLQTVPNGTGIKI